MVSLWILRLPNLWKLDSEQLSLKYEEMDSVPAIPQNCLSADLLHMDLLVEGLEMSPLDAAQKYTIQQLDETHFELITCESDVGALLSWNVASWLIRLISGSLQFAADRPARRNSGFRAFEQGPGYQVIDHSRRKGNLY